MHDSMRPLTSWKEIGAYVGRTARTVQRWERSLGFPVQHCRGRNSGIICAFPEEIDTWLGQRRPDLEPPAPSLEIHEPHTLADFIDQLARKDSLSHSLIALAKALEARDHCTISVLLWDKEHKFMVPIAAPSFPAEYSEAFKRFPMSTKLGAVGPAALQNRMIVSENVYRDPKWKVIRTYAEKARITACTAMPIQSPQGEVLGSLAAYYPLPYRPTEGEIKRLRIASSMAGLAVNLSSQQM